MTGLAHPKPTRRLPAERKRIAAVSSRDSATQHARAWRLCSGLTAARAHLRCEISGKRGTEAHHGFGKKAHPSVKYDGRNLFWLSHEVHNRAHEEPDWFHDEMRRILGNEVYEALKARSVQTRDQDDPADVIEAAKRGRFLVERA